MVKCSAYMCDNATYQNLPGISFHRFPKNQKLCDIWLKNMKLKNWKPKSCSLLCSRHFKKNLISSGPSRIHLFPGAVPTIFNVPKHQTVRKNTRKRVSKASKTNKIDKSFSDDDDECSEIQYVEPSKSSHQSILRDNSRVSLQREQSEASDDGAVDSDNTLPSTSSNQLALRARDNSPVSLQSERSAASDDEAVHSDNSLSPKYSNQLLLRIRDNSPVSLQSERSEASEDDAAHSDNTLPSTSSNQLALRARDNSPVSLQSERSAASDDDTVHSDNSLSSRSSNLLQVRRNKRTRYKVPRQVALQRASSNTFASRVIKKLKTRIILKNKKIKAMREQQRRLRKKMEKFSDTITELKSKLDQPDDLTIISNMEGNKKDFRIRIKYMDF